MFDIYNMEISVCV